MAPKKNFIQSMNGGKGPKKGGLHKSLGVPMGKPIPEKKIDAAAKKGGKVGKQARLAETFEKMRKKK